MYGWKTFAGFGFFVIGYRALISWVPELNLPVPETGLLADFLSGWIVLGIGLILRELQKQDRHDNA